jgi:CubicO group peptidase (beta-lactamase class C family)
MAERAADRSWEELLTGELFQPLGMTSAGFGAMGRPGRIDQPWQHTRVGDQVTPIEPGPRTDNPPVIGPGGTVHCALADWGRFISAHLRGEHQAGGLLAPETYRFLHSTPLDGDYFAGWVTADRSWGGGRVLMHNGSNTMNFAVVWMAPQRGFAVLVASNQGGGTVEKACDEAAAALIGFYLDRR